MIERESHAQLWRNIKRKYLQINFGAFITFMPHIGLNDLRRNMIEEQVHRKAVPKCFGIERL